MSLAMSSRRNTQPVSIDFDIDDVAWVLEKLAAHAFERNALRQCLILSNTAQLLREVIPQAGQPGASRN